MVHGPTLTQQRRPTKSNFFEVLVLIFHYHHAVVGWCLIALSLRVLPLPSSSPSTALLGRNSSCSEQEGPATDRGDTTVYSRVPQPPSGNCSRTTIYGVFLSICMCGVNIIVALLHPPPDVTAVIKRSSLKCRRAGCRRCRWYSGCSSCKC